ncbi:MAG: DUF6398 domain-containing protein [archaeon]
MLTTEFSDKHLDAEYKELCEKLIMKMARKRNVPFRYGKPEIWAAAVIHAVGNINFLFDKSFKPYISAEDLCDYFGASTSAVTGKSKSIRDMFRMGYWDRDFSTRRMKEKDPYANMVSINGLIVDIRMLPPELQEMMQKKRTEEENR